MGNGVLMEPIIRLYGLRATKFMVTRPADRATNLKPVMELIGLDMLKSEQDLFRTEGASGLVPWTPLQESTVQRKKGKGKILDRSGTEEESLTQRNAPYNLFNPTKSFILIGSNAPGVPYQKDGTKNMVKRDPIQFRPDQAEKWTDWLSAFVFRGEL